MPPPKQRIAILGGGIGGLSTGYEIISHQPEQYEIPVFQIGLRLGGKCAESRNSAIADRIEEHGIHCLFGSYENAFHLLRRVYAEIGRNWRSAFEPQSSFTVFDGGAGTWERWDFRLSKRSGEPGDWFEQPPHPRLSLVELSNV